MENADHPPIVSPHRHAHHALLFGPRRALGPLAWVAAVVFAAAAAAAIWVLLFTSFDWGSVVRTIARLDALPLIAAMAVLPLIGFPILPVYLVAGARFGPVGGGFVVAFATAVHLAGSHVIARTILRRPLERLLARWHAHLPDIPPDEQAPVALIAALVPGFPYVIRNYLLAVAGLRLRVYFWICLPIYVARSYVSILVGDLSSAPDRSRLLMLGGVELLKVAICAVVLWRLRVHHRRFHGAHPPAPPSA